MQTTKNYGLLDELATKKMGLRGESLLPQVWAAVGTYVHELLLLEGEDPVANHHLACQNVIRYNLDFWIDSGLHFDMLRHEWLPTIVQILFSQGLTIEELNQCHGRRGELRRAGYGDEKRLISIEQIFNSLDKYGSDKLAGGHLPEMPQTLWHRLFTLCAGFKKPGTAIHLLEQIPRPSQFDMIEARSYGRVQPVFVSGAAWMNLYDAGFIGRGEMVGLLEGVNTGYRATFHEQHPAEALRQLQTGWIDRHNLALLNRDVNMLDIKFGEKDFHTETTFLNISFLNNLFGDRMYEKYKGFLHQQLIRILRSTGPDDFEWTFTNQELLELTWAMGMVNNNLAGMNFHGGNAFELDATLFNEERMELVNLLPLHADMNIAHNLQLKLVKALRGMVENYRTNGYMDPVA